MITIINRENGDRMVNIEKSSYKELKKLRTKNYCTIADINTNLGFSYQMILDDIKILIDELIQDRGLSKDEISNFYIEANYIDEDGSKREGYLLSKAGIDFLFSALSDTLIYDLFENKEEDE